MIARKEQTLKDKFLFYYIIGIYQTSAPRRQLFCKDESIHVVL